MKYLLLIISLFLSFNLYSITLTSDILYGIIVERDNALAALASAEAERDAALAAQTNAETSRDIALAEKASAEAERDARPTQAAYDAVVAERDARYTEEEYNAVVTQRDARPTQAAYETVVAERDAKLTLDEVKDLRAGSTMIEINNDRADLGLQIEYSKDLGLWSVNENTFYDIPTYSVDHIKFSIPADELGSWTIEGNLCTIVTEKFSISADGTEAFITISSGELASWTVEGNLSNNSSDAGVNVPASELGSWTIEGNLCTIKTDNFVNKGGVPFLNVSSPANEILSWTVQDNTFAGVNQNEAYLNLKIPISILGSWTVDGTTFKVSPHKSIISDDEQNFILEIPRTALGWWTVDGADFIVSEDPISIRVGGNAKFQIPVDADLNTKFFRFGVTCNANACSPTATDSNTVGN